MQAASRPYVMAGAVLAAAGLVAVTPIASRPFQLPVLSIETKLVDADSVLNIPVNLLDDILNIPYNEIQALDATAASEFYTGTWWVPSSTNLWGIDPGDTTHIALVTDLLAPFPALDDGVGGLQYEIDGLLAAELPVSASCDAQTCYPIVPPNVITENTLIDREIGFLESVTGQTPFGLFDSWFTVPLSELMSGYNFNSSDDPGVIDPSGMANTDFLNYFGLGSNPFVGGTTGADNAMPWDGLTYTLNLLQPFENFYDSLLATPSTSGIDGSGIEIPTLTQFTDALQAFAAGTIVDFDPYVHGGPICAATCDIPANETIVSLVQDINNLTPGGNPMINEWLADVAAGTANGPSVSDAQESVDLLQTGTYNLTPTELSDVLAELDSVNPELGQLAVNAGILTDPGYLTGGPAELGGLDTELVPQDLIDILGPSSASVIDTPEFTDLLNGLEVGVQMFSGADLETLLNFATFSL